MRFRRAHCVCAGSLHPKESATTMHKGGFTLIEILVVVVLLGILAAVVVPHFSGAGAETGTAALATDLRRVRSQIELYKFHHNDQLPAAPEATLCRTVVRSSPALCAYKRPSQTATMPDAMSVWLTILVCCPRPGPP